MENKHENLLNEIKDVMSWISRTGDGVRDINLKILRKTKIKFITNFESKEISTRLSRMLISELSLHEATEWNIANPLSMFHIIERKICIDAFLASEIPNQ